MQYEFYFPCVSASFSLKWPSRVIKTLRENLLQLNLSRADEIIEGDGIAVPNDHIQFAEAFNERKHKLLLEYRVFTAICAGSCSEFVGGVFKANVGILS
jgi:hypothetical protein